MSILKYWDKDKKQYIPSSKGTPPQFKSGDSLDPNEWTNVALIQDNEVTSSFRQKMSTMVKNVRYLWKLMGNTDISQIGDGTVSGILSLLNNDKVEYRFGIEDLDNPPIANGILVSSANPVGFPSYFQGNTAFVLQYSATNNKDGAFQAQLAVGFGNRLIGLRQKTNSTKWSDWSYFYTGNFAPIIGTTDISTIADGTLTGAVKELNNNTVKVSDNVLSGWSPEVINNELYKLPSGYYGVNTATGGTDNAFPKDTKWGILAVVKNNGNTYGTLLFYAADQKMYYRSFDVSGYFGDWKEVATVN